jgi:hypothetical protein
LFLELLKPKIIKTKKLTFSYIGKPCLPSLLAGGAKVVSLKFSGGKISQKK